MEVFIRGVPHQGTQKSLEEFFSGLLDVVGIKDWTCSKFRAKPFLNLLFLTRSDGQLFLNNYGYGTLVFQGHVLQCSQSRRSIDKFALRGLEMDKKKRESDQLKARRVQTTISGDGKTLECISMSCGIWDDDMELGSIFQAFYISNERATLTFKSNAVVYETTSHRLEIGSQTVDSIVWSDSRPEPALTFLLRECPRIYLSSSSSDELSTLFAGLSFKNEDTDRVMGLDRRHEEVSGTCLGYRFVISKDNGQRAPRTNLKHTRGLPSLAEPRMTFLQPKISFKQRLNELKSHMFKMSGEASFGVKFQLWKLAQNGYLMPTKVIELIPHIEKICSRSNNRICIIALRKLCRHMPYAGPHAESKYFDVPSLISLLNEFEEGLNDGSLCSDEPVSSQLANIHKATVTPSGVYLYGPESECNNRILRKYPEHHDYFLRVQFSDEDGSPIRYDRGISNKPIYNRFKQVMDKGISIGDRIFRFLGFSHSSLRSQSCWFMAPFIHEKQLIFSAEVIKDLGDFTHIRTPARCAARIGQAFSDTRDAISFESGIVKDNNELPDVERNDRVFSDGVGTISLEALKDIWEKLPPGKMKPTILQIRYQGAKGVIALDSRLKGKSVFLRTSMMKFRGSKSKDIEICTAAYRPNELRLNEQLIKILEDIDAPPQYFLNLQAKEIERLRATTSSTQNASKFLRSHSIGDRINLPGFLRKMPQLGCSFQDDNFLTDIVEAAVLIQLRTLKYKARIPVKDGYTLIGIMDETGVLDEGQVFCIVEEDGKARVVTGKNGRRIHISRSPALHGGDVQLAYAVTVPDDSPLMQLRNCICFSQKGSRDLPSMLSGGDLDGDTFHIIFDQALQTSEPLAPADYARLPPRELDRNVEIPDMTEFFIDFMESDQLGRICNQHKITADQSPSGVKDSRCVKLAEMASIAVDFSKTGIPADTSRANMPECSPWRPHFMAPGPHVEIMKDKSVLSEWTADSDIGASHDDESASKYKYYASEKILGKLFDAIDEQEIFQRIKRNSYINQTPIIGSSWSRNSSLLERVLEHIKERCPNVQWEKNLDRARAIRDEYEDSLLDIMYEYGPRPHIPLSEVEVFIGDILGKTGALTTRQRELSISMKGRFDDNLAFAIRLMRGDDYKSEYNDNENSDETASEVVWD